MTLTELYEEFEDQLHGYAVRLTTDAQQADDLVQETFIRAMGHMPLLQVLKRYQRRAWLHKTLKNLFLDQVNVQRRQQALSRQMTKETPTIGYLPERLGEANPFDLLPEQYHDLFQKRYVLGMTSREIGQQLGIPATTVRSRLHLGLKQLRAQRAKLR